MEVSVVMPCLNEAETLESCIRKAKSCIERYGLRAEVVIADNGSTDGSQGLARKCGARVVDVAEKGYGCALRGGIQAAAGRYIVMGDADDSYDFSEMYPFIRKLREGADLVMGSRLRGKIMPGAMPWKNRYIGNPVQTKLGQIMFRCPISDFNCGLRAFTKDAYSRMELVTTTWEFASEMVIKATLKRMKIAEVPVVLHKDGRSRPPHLQPWRAGWRNLRFMLLHSPRWLFLIPGLILFIFGIAGTGLVLPGPREIGGAVFDITTLIASSTALLVGFQVICFAILARAFAIAEGLLPAHPKVAWFQRHFSLEGSLVAGLILAVCGVIVVLGVLVKWYEKGFGPLDYQRSLRLVIPATTLLALGVQTMFTSFFISVLDLRNKR